MKGSAISNWVTVALYSGGTSIVSCSPPELPSGESRVLPAEALANPFAVNSIQSPAGVVRKAHEDRTAGRLDELPAILLPEQGPIVLDLILAVDRFLAADLALRAAVGRRWGPASASAFDRSDVANRLGVFSRDVTVLNESIDGDRAVVTIQVADRIPLQRVNLVRREGGWLIETDSPIPGAAAEIRAMTEILAHAAESSAEGFHSVTHLRAEIASRQSAVARRLRGLAIQNQK